MEPVRVVAAEPFYDPTRSYSENLERGPFGLFARPPATPRRALMPAAHQFLGQPVSTPFGIPAGPLVNGRFVRAALDWGFDLPTYKTVRTAAHACHPWPNVLAAHIECDLPLHQKLTVDESYTAPLSITNSFGVPSASPDAWQPDLAGATAHARPGQVVIGSFQGTTQASGGAPAYIADFALAARLVAETGVAVVEANLSCPNEGTNALLCFDTDRAARVVDSIRHSINRTPLIIKVAYFESDEALLAFVRAVGGSVDAISAINTIPAEVRRSNGEQALPGEGRLRSGVCGSGIRWAGLAMVERLARLREKLGMNFSIVGVGGVTVAADYHAYRQAGADAVQSATGAMWNPALALAIAGQDVQANHELAGAKR